MKLLYTLTTYPPSTGGAQIHQHQLARQLNDAHDIQVVSHWDCNRTDWLMGSTLRQPTPEKSYKIDQVRVLCMDYCICEKAFMAPFVAAYYPMMLMGYPPVNPISFVIEKHLRPYAEMADIVHNVRIGREGLSFASLRAARRVGIPFVLTPVHHPRWVGRKYRAYNKLYTLADALLALTDAEKEILVGLGASKDRVHVIGHGPVLEDTANPGDFLKNHGIDGPMVLFLGQHYAYKGFKELVDAAKIVWEKFPDTHFVFIGPPVESSEDIFRENSDPRIHRLGNVTLQEKTDALAACSLLCVPSTQESFGGVYAEAWCYEKPVIGCNIPAVSEVITGEKDGFLVNQEPRSIADKIILLLDDSQLAKRMGEAGKMKVEEKYTWKRIAERVERVYNSLI